MNTQLLASHIPEAHKEEGGGLKGQDRQFIRAGGEERGMEGGGGEGGRDSEEGEGRSWRGRKIGGDKMRKVNGGNEGVERVSWQHQQIKQDIGFNPFLLKEWENLNIYNRDKWANLK